MLVVYKSLENMYYFGKRTITCLVSSLYADSKLHQYLKDYEYHK